MRNPGCMMGNTLPLRVFRCIIHHFFKLLSNLITTHYPTPKFHKDHVLIGCGISDYLDKFNKFSEKKLRCVIDGRSKYSLRHRKCGIRGFIHELFVSKTRTSEVRASEGF